MAQPTETRQARCPECHRQLYLILLRPDGQHAQSSELPELGLDEVDLKRPVFRSEDQGACRLWVENPHEVIRKRLGVWEEITGSGNGPEGNAPGEIECDMCGPIDLGGLKPYFERIGF